MAHFESLAQDLRYGWRQLRQTPGFTAVAVLSLALGIGANTAIFQLIDAIRLRTLPVQKPQELVAVDLAPNSQRAGWFSARSPRLTYTIFDEIRRQQQAFTGVLAWSTTRFNLAESGEVRYVDGMYVSGEFFQHLGVPAAIGRTFTAEDDTPACGSPGAVVSYSFWQRELGADPQATSRNVTIEGRAFPIVGVTGPNFSGVEVGRRYEVAIPLCADVLLSSDGKGRLLVKHAWWLSMLGRLKPGWTVEKATAHLQAISPGIMQASVPPTYKPDMAKRFFRNKLVAAAADTGVSNLRRDSERPLYILLAITGLVLLIACANVANLLLARGSVRVREVAVRLAMGASRARLVRQLLSESLVLAVAGALLGMILAQVLTRALIAFLTTADNPVFLELTLDWRILGFGSALALATCVLFGILPAARSTHVAPSAALRAGGRGMTAGRERFTLRRALVATQVALSLVLLVGALLFIRSLHNLTVADAGFNAQGVLGVIVDLPHTQYPSGRRLDVQRAMVERVAAQPGVVAASQTFFTPVSGSGWNNDVGPDGAVAAGSDKQSMFNRVAPGYFRTIGTQLIAGRDFDERDRVGASKVAIVNEEFAKKMFNGASPVGRTFHLEAEAGKPETLYQIVGLVRNTKYFTLREDFRPIGYLPIAQDDDPGPGTTLVVRAAGPVQQTMARVTSAVLEAAPGAVIEYRLLSQQLEQSLMRERLMATLSGAFGILAALLAVVGLYGVIAYMVARRRNEIGVRMALGADRARVVRMVLREAAVLLAAGLVAGTVLAVWAGRAAASLLFGLEPHDPLTLAASMVLLTVAALAAGYGPARRAAKLDPMAALREE